MCEDWWPLDVSHSPLCNWEFLLQFHFLCPIIYRVWLIKLTIYPQITEPWRVTWHDLHVDINIGLGSIFSNWMNFYIISLWEGNVACMFGSCGMMLGGQRVWTIQHCFVLLSNTPHFLWELLVLILSCMVWLRLIPLSPFHPLSQSNWFRNGHVNLFQGEPLDFH